MSSLKKSHSKISNLKLTLMCLGLALSNSGVVIGMNLVLSKIINDAISIPVLLGSLLLTILFYNLIGKFTR